MCSLGAGRERLEPKLLDQCEHAVLSRPHRMAAHLGLLCREIGSLTVRPPTRSVFEHDDVGAAIREAPRGGEGGEPGSDTATSTCSGALIP